MESPTPICRTGSKGPAAASRGRPSSRPPSACSCERGFGSVSMDELAEAAGVARRTLYNQFASKEEIFREMLLRVSGQLEDAFPTGIETQGDVEEVLRLIARIILDLHENPEYLGFLRMVVADTRQFPWIAEEFAAVMDPQTERLIRYLAHLTRWAFWSAATRRWRLTSSWGCSTSSLYGPG